MLDMPVPGSFWNIGHQIWGQEGSDHASFCGLNKEKFNQKAAYTVR